MDLQVSGRRIYSGLNAIASHPLAVVVLALCPGLYPAVFGQDLAPRAYVITPIHSNAVVMTYSFFSGNLDFQGAAPITDATANASVPIFTIFHSMSVFKRNASFTVGIPYGVGTFHGTVLGTETNVHRSGLFDSVYRFSMNLIGGPAMTAPQYMKWKQKNILGMSLRVVAPTGQYDSAKLINWGTNRWGFKPEVGYSRRMGHWIVDAYGGTWFYTKDPKFFSENQYIPGVQVKTQAPVGSFEGHLSYDVRPRLWVSLDGNYWFGGKTSINGVENPATEQKNSRMGATVSVPMTKHQSMKFSYNNGAYVRYGGNFQNISVAWQYSWLGRPN
jgi:Putative MetA-pathway of phenol degradation